MWLQALAAMVENYATNPRVVGLDLRNELRSRLRHSRSGMGLTPALIASAAEAT